jgi:DNA processing protein
VTGGPKQGPRLTDAQRLAWLRLIRSENVGTRTFRSLVNHFGGAVAALEALPDLGQRGGARRPLRIATIAEAERELAALDRLGGRLVALGEPDYPAILAHAESAPPLLAILGDGDIARRDTVAIVGARNASAAGRSFAQRLARELGEAGLVVASGLARGVDAAAHDGAIETGTIAVLAGGLDRIYPPEHTELLARLLPAGAAVSEMPMGWAPRAQDFPRRNRIIAGLARGVVVIEAALRSGSLITARLAGELGREVMAAPGSPLDSRCEGSNRLLRDGATLITGAAHVIEALAPGLEPARPAPPLLPLAEPGGPDRHMPDAAPDERARIVELLGPSPAGIDEIVRLSGAPARTVQLVLLELELAGRLERHPGGAVSLRG